MNRDTATVLGRELAKQITPKMLELLCSSNVVTDFIANFNPYCSIKDLSAFTKIPYPTLQMWVAQGRIPCSKANGSDPKIYLSDLKAFVAAHGKEAQLATSV